MVTKNVGALAMMMPIAFQLATDGIAVLPADADGLRVAHRGDRDAGRDLANILVSKVGRGPDSGFGMFSYTPVVAAR